jgi:FkbH-like protein
MADEALEIAVAATFTAEPVEPAIAYLLGRLGIAHTLAFAPYGQALRELVDPAGLFGKSRGACVALVRISDLPPDGARELADLAAAHARRPGAAPLLVVVCPEPPSRAASTAGAEAHLSAALRGAGVPAVGSAEILETYPVASYDDPAADALAHIPYTPEFFAALGAVIARRLRALVSPPHKVLALDCDGTLWNGVVGEDGPGGCVVDEHRAALQRFALRQRDAGMLLALCSKNAEEDVEEVFRRQRMPLERRHVAAARVSWDPKSASLRALAAELGLGLDAFVFLDDSLVEHAEVRAGCPEVLAIHLPADAAEAAALLPHVWAFDRWKVTEEDRRRPDLYRQNAERDRSLREAPTVAEFLAGLGLEIAIAPAASTDMPRIAQLTFRTNQLNFTTVRRSEAEIAALIDRGEIECRKVEVRDRFGDHGLVGALLFRADGGALLVDTFLLSCRVLGRGVEHRMIAHLGALAQGRGLAAVVAPVVLTAKNLPAQAFLRGVAGDRVEPREGGFVARLPAATAAAVVYDPSSASLPPGPAPSPQAPASLPSPPPQNAFLEEIARDLRTAADILARVAPEPAVRPRPPLPAPLVEPRTDEERAVASLCEDALSIRPIGVEDDLFLDLGATSFTAVRIAAGLRARTGRPVEIATVQEARTVARLAAAVAGGRVLPGRSPSIHTLRAGGRKRPLFLARPATRSSGALSYVALARQIDPDRPVHVLQNRPLIDAAPPYESVEAMAAEYVAAVREAAPRGPYLLAGWCLGGKTAFEMANQLAAHGEAVRPLVLFDTAAPGGPVEALRWKAQRGLTRAALRAFSRHPDLAAALPWVKVARAKQLLRRFGVLAYFDPGNDDPALVAYAFPGRFDAAALRAMPAAAMWDHVYAALRKDEPELGEGDGVDAASVRRGFGYFAHDHELDATYAPRWVYGGTVHLFTVRGSTASADGWRRFLAREPLVHAFEMRGNAAAPDAHSAMMSEENVRVMAEALNRVLSEGDAGT